MVTYVLSFNSCGLKVNAVHMLPYRKLQEPRTNIIKPSFLKLLLQTRCILVLCSITFFHFPTVIGGAWISWRIPLPRRILTYLYFWSSGVGFFFALDRRPVRNIRCIHVFLLTRVGRCKGLPPLQYILSLG